MRAVEVNVWLSMLREEFQDSEVHHKESFSYMVQNGLVWTRFWVRTFDGIGTFDVREIWVQFQATGASPEVIKESYCRQAELKWKSKFAVPIPESDGTGMHVRGAPRCDTVTSLQLALTYQGLKLKAKGLLSDLDEIEDAEKCCFVVAVSEKNPCQD